MVGAPSFIARFPLRRVGECPLDAIGRQRPAAIVHSRVEHWVRPRDKRGCLSCWVVTADTMSHACHARRTVKEALVAGERGVRITTTWPRSGAGATLLRPPTSRRALSQKHFPVQSA
jgi:hypothetical protein